MPVDRASRLLHVLERDGRQCVWCERPFTGTIRERGGQRRARPYVAAQLRRLNRRAS